MKTWDVIVVGSGIAGLSIALRVASRGRVLVLSKADWKAGSTDRAQGGIAAAVAPGDSPEKHLQDTLVAGAGLCREGRVRRLCAGGPGAIRFLEEAGVHFSREGTGIHDPYHLGREAAHGLARVLHAEDFTGAEILRALLEAASSHPNIEMRDNTPAVDLITQTCLVRPGGAPPGCAGVYVLNQTTGRVEALFGACTVLCTGGVGQVYAWTTNDTVSTGDGVAMACRAGVPVEDMEFMQFHPTMLYDPGHEPFLISEALRGHGGILRNQAGRAFMEGVHEMRDLAPRDVVSRAIDAEMKQGGVNHVWLDMTALPRAGLMKRFPNIWKHCRDRGIDLSRDRIPVVPAAHFLCGGVRVNECLETRLPGLFAGGETASTGVHGANRLASNSLLEAVVFAELAVERMAALAPGTPSPADYLPWGAPPAPGLTERSMCTSALETVRSTMWNYVGIVRSNIRLAQAREIIRLANRQILSLRHAFAPDPGLIELENLALCAELIVDSALRRKESRGLHYNIDYPQTFPEARHTVLTRRGERPY